MWLKNCADPTGAAPRVVELHPGAVMNRCDVATCSVRWMAAACVADQLTGFIQVRETSLKGLFATTLHVDVGWRRQGNGTLLLAAAIGWAASQRADALRLTCARSDWPMRHLARKFGARLDLVLGQLVADISIDPKSAVEPVSSIPSGADSAGPVSGSFVTRVLTVGTRATGICE